MEILGITDTLLANMRAAGIVSGQRRRRREGVRACVRAMGGEWAAVRRTAGGECMAVSLGGSEIRWRRLP